jgi:hypothetical protein
VCRYTMALIIYGARKGLRDPTHALSLLRRFDRQSNDQHAIVLDAGPGDVWGIYLAVKLPQKLVPRSVLSSPTRSFSTTAPIW